MMKPLVVALVLTLIVDPVLAQMPSAGFLGVPQTGYNPMGNMYNQMGTPVAGAWQGNNMALAGTGSQMMSQCPYQQQIYVNPTDQDANVVAARTELTSMDSASKEARVEASRIKLELQKATADLRRSLRKNGKSVNEFIENMDRCESFFNSTEVTDKDTFLSKIGDEYEGDDSEKVGCYFAAYGKTSRKAGFHAEGLCMAMDTSIDYDFKAAATPPAVGPRIRESRPSDKESPDSGDSRARTKGPQRKSSTLDLEQTGGEQKEIKDGPQASGDTHKTLHAKANTDNKTDCGAAADKVHNLRSELKKADQDAADAKKARDDQLREVTQARKDAAAEQALQAQIDAEKITAQTAGVVCASCTAQKPSVNQGLLWAGVGLAALGAGLSYSLGRTEINNAARMGYVTGNLNGTNIASSFSSGLSLGSPFIGAGLAGVGSNNGGGYAMNGAGVGSYGYPMMQNNLYGTTPGGYSQGGFGCGQTASMSPFAMNQGQMYPGGYPGNFYPGGYQMPGMTQFGIPGNQGFNPYAQQMAMQNYYSDQQRAIYLAQSTAQMGITQAQQQFSLANSYLMGAGNMQYPMAQNYGIMGGASTYGLNNYFGSSYGSSYARQGCGTNPFSLGVSFSICGTTSLGGSYAPTYSNGYNGYNPYGTSLSGGVTYSR